MAATALHLYRCSFCKTVATSPRWFNPLEHPIKCNRCLRIMGYLYAQPIETEEQRAIAAQGIVFNPFLDTARPAFRTTPCGTCRAFTPVEALIELPGVGKFCSEACANTGAQEHERFLARVQKVRDEMPWLVPAQKESA